MVDNNAELHPAYYVVESDSGYWPTEDHLEQGYENEVDYRCALLRTYRKWRGRIGRCIDRRNGFVKIQFVDTPGGKQDVVWLPDFLLHETTDEEVEGYDVSDPENPLEQELDRAFGFD